MNALLTLLRAMAEPTRLRLLALCRESELTVGELVAIVGQSQPSVSRHLKLLCDGGLLARRQEGANAFYMAAKKTQADSVIKACLAAIPAHDPVFSADQSRLSTIKKEREAKAAAYFNENAKDWAALRSMHVDEDKVEKHLLAAFKGRSIRNFLDIGAGTGRIMKIMAPLCDQVLGVDLSREMLAIARSQLEGSEFSHCSLRQGDMYALALPDSAFDAVVIYQVLHFAERPAAVLQEAARVLSSDGLLVLVDFAPHNQEQLRSQYHHLRLGFSPTEIENWCKEADLVVTKSENLPGRPLTVSLWRITPQSSVFLETKK